MEFIGKRFLPWRIKRALVNNHSERKNIAFGEAESIGILFSSAGKKTFDSVGRFVEELTEDGKNVETLAFVSKNADIPPSHIPFFSYNELTILGKLNSPLALKFASKRFDYLLCLDLEPHPFIHNVVALSKARMRVGAYIGEDRNRFFELMIKIDKNGTLEDLIKEMNFFARKLIKNEV